MEDNNSTVKQGIVDENTLNKWRESRGLNNASTENKLEISPDFKLDKPELKVSPGQKSTFGGYGDVNDFIDERVKYYKSLQESEEERAKREKREKRGMILASLGDALGSFHNAYAYAKGEKPMELPSLTERMKARYEKAKAKRDENSDKVFSYLMQREKLMDEKHTRDLQDKNYALNLMKEQRYDSDQKNKNALSEARIGYYNAQSDKNETLKDFYKAKINYLEMGYDLDRAEAMARIDASRASAAASRARASASKASAAASMARASAINNDQNSEWITTTETTADLVGRNKKTVTTKRKNPVQKKSGGSSSSSKNYSNTKKLGL